MRAALGRPATLGRLKKRSEFLAVAATNRRHATPGLVLQVLRTEGNNVEPHAPALRLGFTATKKIGNAVARNRARRRLRAAAAEVLRGVMATKADLVLVARRETIDRPFADLRNDLSAGLRRFGVLP